MVEIKKRWHWISPYTPIIVFILTFSIGIPFAFLYPNPHHEGSILYPAFMVNHGYVPLRDVIIQHPPTTAYLYALAFRAFGEYLIVSRLVTLFALSAVVATVTMVAERFLPKPLAVLFVFAYYMLANIILSRGVRRPWPTLWGEVFFFPACLGLFKWIEAKRLRWLVLAGLLLGCVPAFRLSMGIYALGLLGLAVFGISMIQDKGQALRIQFQRGVFSVACLLGPALLVCLVVGGTFVFLIGVKPFSFFFEFQASTPIIKQVLTTYSHYPAGSFWHDLGLDERGLAFAIVYIWVFIVLFDQVVAASERASAKKIIVIILTTITTVLGLCVFVPWLPSYAGFPAVIVVGIWDYWRRNKSWSKEDKQKFVLLVLGSMVGWANTFASSSSFGGILAMLLVSRRLYTQWQTPAQRFRLEIISRFPRRFSEWFKNKETLLTLMTGGIIVAGFSLTADYLGVGFSGAGRERAFLGFVLFCSSLIFLLIGLKDSGNTFDANTRRDHNRCFVSGCRSDWLFRWRDWIETDTRSVSGDCPLFMWLGLLVGVVQSARANVPEDDGAISVGHVVDILLCWRFRSDIILQEVSII